MESENAPATEERTESVEESALPEAAESESPNEEASAAKQGSRLPIVPIAASVVALAILLVVVLLVAKRKKACKE